MRRKSTARLRPFRLLHLAIASLLLLGTFAFSESEPSESDVFLEVSSELDTTLEGDSCPKQSSCTDCLKTGEGACKWCPRKSFGPGVFSAAKEGVCVSAHSPLENGCTVTEKENAFANKGWIFGASDEEPSAVCAAYKHIPKPNSHDALNPAPNPLRRSGFGTRGFIERIRSTVTSVGAHFRVGCSEGLDCLQCAQLRSKVGGACKFCPADSVVDRAYLSELPPGAKGTCFAVGSTDVHARDTYEHIKGACTVSKDENEHAVRGWLRGIDRDNPASPSQAKQICKSVSNPSSRSSSSSSSFGSSSSSSSSNSTSMSFRTMPALDTLQKNKITLRVLEGLSHELQQLLYLRSIDFAFFSTAFKSHFLPPSVSKSKVSAIVPHISMVSTPREEGFGFYRTLLSASAGGLMTNGGKQKIFVFRDVSYNNIWSAYVHMLTEVYQQGHTDPGTILSALKKKSKATLEGELMKNTEAAANDHNALDSPEGRVMRTSGKILLGLTIPFTFGLLSIAAESADMALMLSLDAKRQQNVELKTQILLAALYGYESELQKGRSCSILSNDCADGEYCKREFIFLPSDQAAFSKFPYSPKGFCAKTQTKLLDNGMACFLHSDCKSGHCSFGGLSVMNEDSNEGVDITARDGFARGDMGVSSEKHVTLTPEQRLIALSGVCMRVSSKGISGCRTISPRHEFAECPPPKRR